MSGGPRQGRTEWGRVHLRGSDPDGRRGSTGVDVGYVGRESPVVVVVSGSVPGRGPGTIHPQWTVPLLGTIASR